MLDRSAADLDEVDDDVVEVRGKVYRREVPTPSPPGPRLVDTRSRWRRTDISFGPAGRVACTVLAFVPLWRLLATSSLFWLLTTVAVAPLMVMWLRDTWRRA